VIRLISPTEHKLHGYYRSHDIPFRVSSLPEKHGMDIVTLGRVGPIGFQRKTLPDLQASLLDGRLYLELAQFVGSDSLPSGFLIIESELRRTVDGELIDSSISLEAVRSIIAKCYSCGVGHFQTTSIADTSRAIDSVSSYLNKPGTSSIRRPKLIEADGWGNINNRSYALFLLQSFPSIGPRNAAAILDHFGRIPFSWSVTEDELTAVPGIGPKTAKALIQALNP
jgi:ERCC4-type nuclease